MRKCTVALMLVGLVTFFGGVAQGSLVNLNNGIVEQTPGSEAIFPFTITTTNETSITWTGYMLTLDPAGNATFVDGSGQSTDFKTVLYPDLWTIEFWSPDDVLPGEIVTLEFKVNVPDEMQYTFALTQTPIPEPATAAILGLGALTLLVRRRKI